MGLKRIHFLVNYYNSSDEERQKELDECLWANIGLRDIYKVHILVDEDTKVPDFTNVSKVEVVRVDTDRMTYQGFFNYINENIGKLSIAVIANADIKCNHSIAKFRKFVTHKQAVALRRWELFEKDWKLIPINSSQDLWALQTPINSDFEESADFGLGIPGCDNRIAHILSQHYTLINPANKIITKHIHKSHERSYGPRLKGKIRRINVE